MKSKHQWLVGALATACTTVFLTQSYVSVASAKDLAGFKPTAEQKITTRQVALLLDKAHYLEQPLDEEMGAKMLKMYIDSLDPNHTLFLQSDVDEFTKKYASTYASRLKKGDLSAGIEIFERYRTRSNQYYDYAKALLAKEVNLNTNKTVVIDREKLSHFTTTAAQQDYWHSQTIYALINLTLGQKNEKARDQAFIDDPSLARGQDLIKAETRTPNQILLKRLERQAAQLARLKDDEIMETILNSAMLSYDPHSTYFAPVQANEMQIQSNLELEGIGVTIRPDRKNPDYTRIVTLVEGGPAAKTGQIRPNDLILAVSKENGEMTDVVGYSTQEIVALIRGKRGTTVTVRVKQPNAPDSSARNVSIVRDVIAQEESGVQHRVISDKHKG
ncbi:MAG: PDZ domain-containing protein, partial [Moraxella sp.]|nr:PDZ domain-containing protein [Moraxella sp.]